MSPRRPLRRVALLPAAALACSLAALPAEAAPVTAVAADLGAPAAPQEVLARVQDRLGVEASEFAFTAPRTSLIGTHVRGRQVVGGVPVAGTAAAVHVLEGRVRLVQAVDSDLPGGPVRRPVARAVAERAAVAALGAGALDVQAERLLVPSGGRLVDTWRVGVVGRGSAATVDVSAATGTVLRVVDDRRSADATATLFDPNPIATSGLVDLRQDVDVAGVDLDVATDPRVDAELTDLPLREFDAVRAAAGNLVGPWVDVRAAGPVVPVGGRLDVTKTDPRFEGLMAYHHVDAVQRWFRDELGLTDVNAEPQTVVALPVMGFDNSFYQPANDLILLGAGGVDDGEDAEVIVHELGHAIHDDQVPGWGEAFEGGAMGEGFGDFLAAAYFATRPGTVRSQDACVMEWDATSYSSAAQTCLRRTDTTKTYADRDSSVHSTGEIWSRYLWDVRARMGSTPVEQSENALKVLLSAHFLMTPQADFREAVEALLVAAPLVAPDAETGEAWVAAYREEAVALGLPL